MKRAPSPRAQPARDAARLAGPRTRRGSPDETRSRLVNAAAEELERVGYFRTDTNRIARAAGYAPGTFYKHFADKRAVFLEVYHRWIDRAWKGLAAIVLAAPGPRAKAEQVADYVIEHHRAWPGLRASLGQLVALDPEVREAHRASRRKQVSTMKELGLSSEVDSVFLLMTVERIADAIASHELRELGISDAEARDLLVDRIEQALSPRAGPR